MEHDTYSCAPGENNTPDYMLMDDEFEVFAFPDLFPFGTGGYSISGPHETKLSMHRYLQQWLLNVNGQFTNIIEYLFCAQYATEINQIKSNPNIALCMKWDKTLDGAGVTCGILCNPDVVCRLIKSEQA